MAFMTMARPKRMKFPLNMRQWHDVITEIIKLFYKSLGFLVNVEKVVLASKLCRFLSSFFFRNVKWFTEESELPINLTKCQFKVYKFGAETTTFPILL